MHFNLRTMLRRLLPLWLGGGVVALWAVIARSGLLPDSVLPSPLEVWYALTAELLSGRLPRDLVASLYRVVYGFLLSILIGIPLGLYLGTFVCARRAALPYVNFLRSLSPLAWIPFAILWFGIGDAPAIFLIFMSTFFPLVISTVAAVANIPAVYFRIGREYHFTRLETFRKIMIPAIGPQIITALRVTIGIAWVVVVAAEMIAGNDGLGFAIWDARNGMRMDLLVAGMISIGATGVLLDRMIYSLSSIPSVRWGYEQ